MAPSKYPPAPHPIAEKDSRLVTRPWLAFFQQLVDFLFTTFIVSGQGDVQPAADGSITLIAGTNITLTTAGSSITINSTGGGSGGAYVPVSDGAEPLVILSNGAGEVLLVPYTP